MAKTQPANHMSEMVSQTSNSIPKHPLEVPIELPTDVVVDSHDSYDHSSSSSIAASEARTYVVPPEPMTQRAVFPFGYTRQHLQRYTALGITAVIAIYFLIQVQVILPPFLIALFLSALLDPSIRHLERRGRSRVYAIFLFYLLGLLALILVFTVLVPKLLIQVDDIRQYQSSYTATIQKTADHYLTEHSDWVHRLGIKQTKIAQILDEKSGPLKKYIDAFLGSVTGFLTGIASKAVWLIIIPVSGFFLMRDYPVIRARAIALFPDSSHDQLDRMSTEIVDVFGAYLRGLAKICALYGVWTFLLLLILNVKYALFLGIMAGLFYAIPYLGQLMSASIVGVMAYTMDAHSAMYFMSIHNNSLFYAILAACALIISNNVFDQIIYPRVVGESVGLHPVISFFALASGATLFGIWGMLLAVPVAASIQVILMSLFPKIKQPPLIHLLEPPGASTKTS